MINNEGYCKVTSVDGIICFVPRSEMSDKIPIRSDVQSFRKIKCSDGVCRWFSSSELCLVKPEPNNTQNAVDNAKAQNTLYFPEIFKNVVDGVYYSSDKEYRKQKKSFEKRQRVLAKAEAILSKTKVEEQPIEEKHVVTTTVTPYEYYNGYMEAYTKREARSAYRTKKVDDKAHRYDEHPISVRSFGFKSEFEDYTDEECYYFEVAPVGAYDLKKIEDEVDAYYKKHNFYTDSRDYNYNHVKDFKDRLPWGVLRELLPEIESRLDSCIIMNDNINSFHKDILEYERQKIEDEKRERQERLDREYERRREQELERERRREEAKYRETHPEEYEDEDEWQ